MISPEQQQAYHDLNPNNIIHVDYGLDIPGRDKYEFAAKTMDQWLSESVLVQDEKPAIYVTEHEFQDLDGSKRSRIGFIALLKIETFASGNVLPHEKTFKKHKKDRLQLLRATGAQINPVFTFFPDPQSHARDILSHASAGTPDQEFDFVDGAVNRMWRLTDEADIAALQKILKKQPVFIADGHHRYETMMNFRKEMKKKLGGTLPADHPARFGLVYFCASEDPGLEVTSPHRLIKGIKGFNVQAILDKLNPYFTIEATESNCVLDHSSGSETGKSFALQIGEQYYCLTTKPGILEKAMPDMPSELRVLHVTICRNLIIRPLIRDDGKLLEHVSYVVDHQDANRAVASGNSQIAVYMPHFDMKQLMDAVATGEVLPHKSTYFYPKLVTGLVIYRFSVK